MRKNNKINGPKVNLVKNFGFKYFGYYSSIGECKKKHFENFAHFRDLYFHFAEIKPNYLSSDRKFVFTKSE